jgi:glutathione S-transferase
MPVILYYSPGACSMSAHIALEEVGAEYELRVVKLAENQQRQPDYLAINPRGRVPVLVLDDGTVLTECAAILLYLARKFPKAKLWPEDPLAQARCIEWLSWLASSVHVAFAQTRRPPRFVGQNPDSFQFVKTAGMVFLRAAYLDIERRLANSEYAVGDSISIADLHLYVFFVWGRGAGFLAPAASPAFMRWGEKMVARPSVQRVIELEGLKPPTKH